MSAPRRVLESMNRPYSAATLDAAVERQARGGASGLPSSSGPQTSVAEPFREAHLESVTTRSAPSTVRASALERLGAHLAADENFGRKLSRDAARALAGVEYLTDREKHILAGADKRVWDKLADASDKFHVAAGKKGVAGVPSGPSSIGDYLGGFKFGSGSGGPTDWENASTPGRGGITLGSGVKVPGSAGDGPSGGSGSGGSDDGGRGGGEGPQGPPVPPGPRPGITVTMPASSRTPAHTATIWIGGQAAKEWHEAEVQAYEEALVAYNRRTIGELKKESLARSPSNPTQEAPPPPPKDPTANPNPEDPEGPAPVGPWARGQSSRGAYNSAGRYAVPNEFDPKGPGPVGP